MLPAWIRSRAWLATGPALAAILAVAAHVHPHVSAAAIPQLSTRDDDNPTVTPGKVRWHASFAAAQAAAQRSGKPVLLFHLMGRLDRQFC